MNAPSIRWRVMAALLLLIAVALLEAGLVVYVQRQSEMALAEANRSQRLLHDHDHVGETLAAMQAAQRGYVITAERSELARYMELEREYETAASALPLIMDAAQRVRFDRVAKRVKDWRDISAALMARRGRGEDVMALLTSEANPRFESIRAELDAFEARQRVLAEAATNAARDRIRNATVILGLGTLLATGVVIALMVLASRWIRLHLETRETVARLRELDRMKDEFVSVVSHELRTPLTAIRGSLQLLLDIPGASAEPANRELLEVALKSCDRLVRLTNDILDISTIEAGRLTLNRREVAVADLVQHSVETVQPVADQVRVQVVTNLEPEPPSVWGDPDRLTQALVNLLSNAVKFSPREGTVTVAARADGDYVKISIKDQGNGISPADFSRLFHKFERLESSASRRLMGTGLGLVITRAIIEEHGGRVSVESRVGRGTTFTLAVPRA